MSDLIPESSEPQNLDATVFVFRHRPTGEIVAHYVLAARGKELHPDWEHVGTLEPRLWIQAHWDDAKTEREACAALCVEVACGVDAEVIEQAIRARSET